MVIVLQLKQKMVENKILPEEENELYEHYSFVVEKGQKPLRVDKYLMNFIENATRSKIQASAKEDSIRVNGIPVKSSYKVKPSDETSFKRTDRPTGAPSVIVESTIALASTTIMFSLASRSHFLNCSIALVAS